jgi:hypothetical protein
VKCKGQASLKAEGVATLEFAPRAASLQASHPAMEPVTNSIVGKVYDGVISVVSYFALEYTANWNWHLEDLGSLIPVR